MYNCDRGNLNGFTKAEKLSIFLSQLIKDHNIKRDAYREIVRYVNTVIRDHDEMMKGMIQNTSTLYDTLPTVADLTFTLPRTWRQDSSW